MEFLNKRIDSYNQSRKTEQNRTKIGIIKFNVEKYSKHLYKVHQPFDVNRLCPPAR